MNVVKNLQSYRGTSLVFLSILIFSAWAFGPYLKMFILAVLTALVVQPLFIFLKKKFKSKNTATVFTTLLILLLVIIPVAVFAVMMVNQIQSLVSNFQNFDFSTSQYSAEVDKVKALADRLLGAERVQNLFLSIKSTILTFVKNSIIPLGSSTVSGIVNVFLFIFMFIFTLPNAKKMADVSRRLLPIDAKDADSFVTKLTASIPAVFISLVLSALLQAVATGLIFWVLGVPAVLLLSFTAFFLSFFPFGSGILTIPVGIMYLLSGDFLSGIILILYHLIIVSNIDNVVKIKLYGSGSVQIPGWLTLLSTLGGLATFGFWGVVFGPLIAVALMSITQIYLSVREQEGKSLDQDSR